MPRLNQKGVAHLLLPIILILGLIAGVYLITSGNPLKLFSKASNAAVVFKNINGSSLPEQNGVPYITSPRVKIEFTSSLGGPARGGNLNLTDFKKAYGSKRGDARYNPDYDLNNDGAVNITDFSLLGQKLAKPPVSSPVKASTLLYRFAESPTDLDTARYLPYTREPAVVTYTFDNPAPGAKFIWADFKDSTGRTDRRSAQVELISATSSPTPSPNPWCEPASVNTFSPYGCSSNNIFYAYCIGANFSCLDGYSSKIDVVWNKSYGDLYDQAAGICAGRQICSRSIIGASGEIIATLTGTDQYNNYHDININGTLTGLVPNRDYDLLLCPRFVTQTNCARINNSAIRTDNSGNASFNNLTYRLTVGNTINPRNSLLIKERPPFQDNPPGCVLTTYPCLTTHFTYDGPFNASISLGVPSVPTPAPTPTPAPKRVFVSSTSTWGDLGGLSGADAKCQADANDSHLGGIWKAWLSTTTVSASSRLTHATVPYKLVDGTTIANDWNDLTDGSLQHAINEDVSGSSVGNTSIWTNTLPSGETDNTITDMIYPGGQRINDSLPQWSSCNEWTTRTDSTGRLGGTVFTNGQWTKWGSDGCSGGGYTRLYCFEQ